MKRWNLLIKEENTSSEEEHCVSYYQTALKASYLIMGGYFILYMIYCLCFQYRAAFWTAVSWVGICLLLGHLVHEKKYSMNCSVYVLFVLGWVLTFAYLFGWNCGGQHFIMPLIVVLFFNVRWSNVQKIICLSVIFGVRMLIYYFTMISDPVCDLTALSTSLLQIINTVFVFGNLAVICVIFSTNIQKAEKQLLLYNEKLYEQASTDPLTALWNRRQMMTILEKQLTKNPQMSFCVAMGDIDLFKKINDTYGHDCGDKVLFELAGYMKETIGEAGIVCRWGGEEFFIFLPGRNLDEAGTIISEMNIRLGSREISYKDEIIKITMTFGVEEYDFKGNLTELIKRADEKLYYGKKHGRNCVIC